MKNLCPEVVTYCPLCESGILTTHIGQQSIEIDGNHYLVPDYYTICNVCEIESAGPNELRRNKQAVELLKTRLQGG